MKIFTATRIRSIDKYTIENEPIASIDLMERAATAFTHKFITLFEQKLPICIFAGPGNNGGDALAVARMLLEKNYQVRVVLLQEDKLTPDCAANLERLRRLSDICITLQNASFVPPQIEPNAVIIDGIFGTGLTRPLRGAFADAVKWINTSSHTVVAIDLPSGLATDLDKNPSDLLVKANYTLSFQFPKVGFLLPENEQFVGNWSVLDIALSSAAIRNTNSNISFTELADVQALFKARTKFQHKGNFGHLYLIAGSETMAGAAVLSAKAALRTGAGLLTVQSAPENRAILQTAVPEAIFSTAFNKNSKYTSLAIGPGLGTNEQQKALLESVLTSVSEPIIIDADGINLLASNAELLKLLPPNTILSPHPKELERIVGKCANTLERIKKAQTLAAEQQVIIILKGAHTVVCFPNGELHFNSTGNPGMATAGSGDVLTGILGALLAQSYAPTEASLLGVFLHGKAADIALCKQSYESLIASDIIENIGNAFKCIESSNPSKC